MSDKKICNQRQVLFDDLSKNIKNNVKIINGKYKGKIGEILRIGGIRNSTYNNNKNKYHNYFDLTILIDDKKVVTSCRNVRVLE